MPRDAMRTVMYNTGKKDCVSQNIYKFCPFITVPEKLTNNENADSPMGIIKIKKYFAEGCILG